MPLLAAACWFAIGIVIAHTWIPTPVLAGAVILFIGLIFLALRYSLRVTVLPLAALWIAAGAWCWQVRPTPAAQRALLPYADGLSRDVRGSVVRIHELPQAAAADNGDRDPTWWEERETEGSTVVSIDVAIHEIEDVTPDISQMVPANGGVRVTLIARDQPIPMLSCGDVIQLPLRLRTPQRFNDPGAWQYEDYLLAQGIGFHANARTKKLRIVSHDAASLRCRLWEAQTWASTRVLAYVHSPANLSLSRALRLTEEDAAMLNAMLFGDRTRLTKQLRLGFERTGSFHLFVVSGMHIALLAGMLLWLLRRLRVRDWIATLITLPAMTAYALLTGFGAPVQRALFMTAVFLAARLLSRERSVMNAAGAAVLAELVWSPSSLFDASFQMTFLAVFAIAGIAIPLAERTFTPWARASQRLNELWRDPLLPPHLAQWRTMLRLWCELLSKAYGRWLYRIPSALVTVTSSMIELALIGLIAELVMALPMAMYFHRATLFALPANMFTVPIIGLLAPLAICLFLASLISPALAVAPAAIVAGLLHAIGWIIANVSRAHIADLRIPAPVWYMAALAFFTWSFCVWAVRQSKAWAVIGALALPLGTLIALWPQAAALSPGQMEVTAIDVGQGDSLLVVSPDGRTMLVDAGGPVGSTGESAIAASTFDIGDEVVSQYLWTRRIRRLDVLALSHAHSDHMGGMPAVMRNLRPRELWLSTAPDSDAYRSLLEEAKDLGIIVRHLHAGDEQHLGDTRIQVLAPEREYTNGSAPVNNDSLVMRLDYGASSVLLEGDAEAQSEQAMLHRGLSPVTLLKVGHHGSKTSTTEEFYNALRPRDAVVSVGRGNTFGHPRGEIIARIANGGSRLYRTDEFGLTTFLLDPDGSIHERLGSH